jgi:branched-subunit amino acid aminotransferase/4-amino-4-deoxychorismate lyase
LKYTWINGNYVESAEASLGVGDLAIQRGYGIFDFFRCRQGVPFLLHWYLDRFFNSAKALNLAVPLSKAGLTVVIQEFIDKNQLVDEGVRMLLTGGYAADSYTPLEPNLVISAHKINFPAKEKYAQGFKVMTHEYQRESPTAKTINYLQGIQLVPVLKVRGLDDVLYHRGGVITEFPRSNIFIVDQQDQLVTPAKNVLAGITRKTVLYLAKVHYSPTLRDITLPELQNSKEVFLTSTTKGIVPVCEIDGQSVGSGSPGTVTQHLAQLLGDLAVDFSLVGV